MSATVTRRGGGALLDDAIDRIRGDWFVFALLHLLPSLPFFAATLFWFVRIDLRGAMPGRDDALLPILLVPKILGWGALSAWAAAGSRGRACGAGAAWRAALRRLPEVLLGGALYLASVLAGLFTVVGFAGVPLALTAMAAAVAGDGAGGWTAVRQSWRAAAQELGQAFVILAYSFCAWIFVALNLWLLPVLLMALGAGGLGFDLSLVANAFGLDRAASAAFAGLAASTLLEGVIVVAFAELQRDREAEREGTRFETFAAELEARASKPQRLRAERVA